MTLAQTPFLEDEGVAVYLRERFIEHAPRARGQDHVLERASRHDGLDDAAATGQAWKQAGERIGHVGELCTNEAMQLPLPARAGRRILPALV
jgi:hypothetical protein